jgi:hypothetical protein
MEIDLSLRIASIFGYLLIRLRVGVHASRKAFGAHHSVTSICRFRLKIKHSWDVGI